MTKSHAHIGSTFESWLDEVGIREEVTAVAVKAVIAAQIGAEMKKQKITKSRMAELMQTSRAQVDRLLDPANDGATLETLMRAARDRPRAASQAGVSAAHSSRVVLRLLENIRSPECQPGQCRGRERGRELPDQRVDPKRMFQ